jgi:amino acid permease
MESGILFAIFNLFFLLVTYGEYSLLTLMSYFVLTLVLSCVGYTLYMTLIPLIKGSPVDRPLE